MDLQRRRGRARKQAGPSRGPSHSLGPVSEDQQVQLAELDLLGFLSQFQVAASDLASGRQHSASCGQSASFAAWGPAGAAPSKEGSEELTSSLPSAKPTSATYVEAADPPHAAGAPVASAAPTLRPVLPLFQEISEVREPDSSEEVQEQPLPSPPQQPQEAGEQGLAGADSPQAPPGPPQPEPAAAAVGDDVPSPAELRAASDAVGRILRDLGSDADTPRWAALATQAPISGTFGSPTLPSLPLATQAPSPRCSPLLLMLTAAAGAGGRRQSGSGGALPVTAPRVRMLAADSPHPAGPALAQQSAQDAEHVAADGSEGPAAAAAAAAQEPTGEKLAGMPAPAAQDAAAVSDAATASRAQESEAVGHQQGLQLVAETDSGTAREPRPSSLSAPESAANELAVQQSPWSTMLTKGGVASSRVLSQDRPASSGGAVRAVAGDAAATNEGLAQMELDGQPPSGAMGAGVAPSSPREQGGSAAGSQEEEFADAVEDLPPGLPAEGDGTAAEEDREHRSMPTYMPLTQQLFSPGTVAPSPQRQLSGSPRAYLAASSAGAASPASQHPLPSPSPGSQQRLRTGEHMPCSPLGRPAAQQEASRAATPSAGAPSGHGESSQLRQRSAVGSESHQGSVGNGSQDDSAATGGNSQKRGRGWLSPLNMVRNAFRQRPSKAGSEGKGPIKVPLLTQQRSRQPSPQPSGSGPTRQQPSHGASPAVAGPPGDSVMRQQDSSSTRAPRNLPQLEVCPSATAWNAMPPAAAPMDVDGSSEARASQPAMAAMPFSQAPGGTSLLAAGQDVPVPGKELLHKGAERVEAVAAQHAETSAPAARATLAAGDASSPAPGARGGVEEPAMEAVAPTGSASAGKGTAAEQVEPQQHSAAIQRRLSGFLSLLEHLPPSQAGTPHGSPAAPQPPSPRLPFTQPPTSQPQAMPGASTGEERQRHSAAAVVGGAPTLHGVPSGEAAGVAPMLSELRLSAPSLAAAMVPSMALGEQQLQEPQAPHGVPAAAGAQATSAAPMPAFAKQPDMEGSDQAGCAAGEAHHLGANKQGMVGPAGATAGGTSAESGGGCELLVPPTQVVLLPASLSDCTTTADAQAVHSCGGSPSLMPSGAVGAAAAGSDSGAAEGEPSQQEQLRCAEPLPSVEDGGPVAAAPASLGEEEAEKHAVLELAPLPGSEEGPTLGSEEAMTPPFPSWQESQLEQVPPTPATLPTSQPPGPECASLFSSAGAAAAAAGEPAAGEPAAGEPAEAAGTASQQAERRALATGLVDSAFKSAIASAGKAEEAAQQAERVQLAAALTDSAFKAALVAVAGDAAAQEVHSPSATEQAVSAAVSESITLAGTVPASSPTHDRQPEAARSGPEGAAAEPAQQPAPAFSFPVLGGGSISGKAASPATGSPVQLAPTMQRVSPSGGGPLPLPVAQPSAAATDEALPAGQASPPAAAAEGRERSKRRFLEEISNNHSEDLDTLLRQQPKKLHKPALSLGRTAAAKPATSSSGSETEGDATEAEAEAGSHAQTSEELPAAQQPELGAALAVASSLQQALLAAASAQAAPLPAPAEPPATKPRPAARSMDTQTRRPPLAVASAVQTASAPAMKSSAAQTQQLRRPPLRLAVQVQTEAWQPTYRSVGIQTIPVRRTGVSCEMQTERLQAIEVLQADKVAATDPRVGMADAQVQARPQLTFRGTSPEPGVCSNRHAVSPAVAVPATVEPRAAAAASGRPAALCPVTKPAAPCPGKPVAAPKPASTREAGKGQPPQQQQPAGKQAQAPPAVEKQQPASQQVPVVQRAEQKAQMAKQQHAKQEAVPAKKTPPQQQPPASEARPQQEAPPANKGLPQQQPPASKAPPQPQQSQREQERGKKRPAPPAGASADAQLKRCKVQPGSSGRLDEVKALTVSPAQRTAASKKRPPPGAASTAGFEATPQPAPSSAQRPASVPPPSGAAALPDGRRASSLPPSLRQPSFLGSGTPGLALSGVAKAGWLREAVAGGEEPPAPKQARHGAGSNVGMGQQRCNAGATKRPGELPGAAQPRGAVHSHAKPRAPAAVPTATGRSGAQCLATPRAGLGTGTGLGAATAQEPPMSPMEILRQRIARDSAKYQAARGQQQGPGHAGPAAAGGQQRSRLSGQASPFGPAGMQLPGWQGQAVGEAYSARRGSSALPAGLAGGPPLRHGTSSVQRGFATPYSSPYGYSIPAPWQLPQPPQSLQLFNGQVLQTGRAGACCQPAVGPSPYQHASGGLAAWQQQAQHLLQQQPTSLLDLVMGMPGKAGM